MTQTTDPFLGELDLHLLSEGRHYRTYEKLGAHPTVRDGVAGTHFAVWAPNAREVSVIGEFNGWRWGAHPLAFHPHPGIWEGFVPGAKQGQSYKYAIASAASAFKVEKADPHAFLSEPRPQTASKIWSLDGYEWGDKAWMADRERRQAVTAPMVVYEVHLGSWMRGENNRWLSYRELAPLLVEWVKREGFTHVELLPINEHPFDGSWGYQSTGYFAPTSRFGTPQDLMFMIDELHKAGVGVILDWVPAHFPGDEHGLVYFDGTHLYEHSDPRQGRHTHWNTNIFNFGRREVSNFLISNALFWLDKYHIDGLRVDAVASMLYLDYGRDDGAWIPNRFGGRENLEAIEFLRRFNEQVGQEYPGVLTIAEESTAWPLVSRPPADGGLGFHLKWNMGWMHDMLEYMQQDPLFRPGVHNKLTFSMMYNYAENYVLAFSHDEVVHLKKSMLSKMPGDNWQKFANLRLLYGYMVGHPGKKLMFMGGEFGQWAEWNHDKSLDWHLLENPMNLGLADWVGDLNRLYQANPTIAVGDYQPWGFKWITCDDREQSVVAFLRYDEAQEKAFAFICNFTPLVRQDHRLGVPWAGEWKEVLNSDAARYGGGGVGNAGAVTSEPVPFHELDHSIRLTLPPLGILVLESPAKAMPKPKKVKAPATKQAPTSKATTPKSKKKAPPRA
ncbi:MAG: glycogen branching enzyme [Cyanobacteria bacterium RYN_339]|nr:glycogen branching enzyme [Cyanobacteria bacterium RYN_339]